MDARAPGGDAPYLRFLNLQTCVFLGGAVRGEDGECRPHRFLGAAAQGAARPDGGTEFRNLVPVRNPPVGLRLSRSVDATPGLIRSRARRRCVGYRVIRLWRCFDFGGLNLTAPLVEKVGFDFTPQNERPLRPHNHFVSVIEGVRLNRRKRGRATAGILERRVDVVIHFAPVLVLVSAAGAVDRFGG